MGGAGRGGNGLGIVPKEAAEHIRECAKWENMNMDEVQKWFLYNIASADAPDTRI